VRQSVVVQVGIEIGAVHYALGRNRRDGCVDQQGAIGVAVERGAILQPAMEPARPTALVTGAVNVTSLLAAK